MKLTVPKPTNNAPNELLAKLFEARDQAHYWHFQTLSYAEHKALNKFFDGLIELIDSFFEAYQGKYGRAKGGLNIKIVDYDGQIISYLNKLREFIRNKSKSIYSDNDSELANIIDEIVSLIDSTQYLLTLK